MALCDLLLYQHQAAHFSLRVLKVQIRCIRFNSYFFSKVLIEECNGRCDRYSVVLKFFGLKVEAVVEVGESSTRFHPFRTRCQTLSSCHQLRDEFDGSILFLQLLLRDRNVVKGLKPSLCGDIGLVVLSGLESRWRAAP